MNKVKRKLKFLQSEFKKIKNIPIDNPKHMMTKGDVASNGKKLIRKAITTPVIIDVLSLLKKSEVKGFINKLLSPLV